MGATVALSQRREAPERRVENNGGGSRDEGFQREMLGRVGGTPVFYLVYEFLFKLN